MPSRQNLKYSTPSIQQPKKTKVSTMSEGERFIQRALDSASFGITGEITKRLGGDVSFRESRGGAVENVADFFSTALGFFVPGLGWVKGIQALSKAPKLGKFATSLLAKKAVPEVAQGALKPTAGARLQAMGKTAASRAKEGALFGAAYTVPQLAGRAINPQDYTAQQNLGLAAQNIIGGAVFDPILGGAGDVLGAAGAKLFTPKVKLERAEAPELTQMELEPEFQPTPAVLSQPVQPTVQQPVQAVVPEVKVEAPKPVKKVKEVSNQKEIDRITKENEKVQQKITEKEKELAKYEEEAAPPSFDPKEKSKIDKEISEKEQEKKKMSIVRNSLNSLNNKKIRLEELKKELSSSQSNSEKISINNQIESLELQIKEDEIKLNELKNSSLLKDVETNIISFDETITRQSKEIDSLKAKSYSFGKFKITPEELKIKQYAVNKTKKELEELRAQVKQVPKLKIEKVEEPVAEVPKVTKRQFDEEFFGMSEVDFVKSSISDIEKLIEETKKRPEKFKLDIEDIIKEQKKYEKQKNELLKIIGRKEEDINADEEIRNLYSEIHEKSSTLDRDVLIDYPGIKQDEARLSLLEKYRETLRKIEIYKNRKIRAEEVIQKDIPELLGELNKTKEIKTKELQDLLKEQKVEKPKAVPKPKVEEPKVEEVKPSEALKQAGVPKEIEQRYTELKQLAKDLVEMQKNAIKTGNINDIQAVDKKLQQFEKNILPVMNNYIKKIIDKYKENPSDFNKKAIIDEYESLMEQSKLFEENANLFSGKAGYNKDDFIKYRKALINTLSDDDIVKILQVKTPKLVVTDGVGTIETQVLDKKTADFIVSIALDRYKNWKIKDYKGVGKDKLLMGFSTIDRVLDKLFDEIGLIADSKNLYKRLVLDGFTQGKKNMDDFVKHYTDGLFEWTKKGFTQGSELSQWTQIYGEGLTKYEDLVKAFGKKDADLIVEFDAWNKKTLKELLDAQNEVLRAMGLEEIKPLENYYRHIYDPNADSAAQIIDRKLTMSSGGGLPLEVRFKDLFKGEDPRIRTAEEVARTPSPESKFNPTRQRRTTEVTVYDAVKGMNDYIMHASYQIHISPYINFFKSLSEKLASIENPNLVPFQNAIDSFTKSLQGVRQAGDTFLDRYTSERTIKFVEWLNNRIKRNNVIGSATAALAQFTNLAPAAAALGAGRLMRGISTTLKYSLLNKNKIDAADPANSSAFLAERFNFLDRFRRFETSMFEKATNATAKVTLEYADAFVAKSIWYGAYEQALKEGVPNPILRADDIARKLVAGRGIGEKSAVFSDRLTEAFLPFQIDVANIVSISTDVAKRDPQAFAGLLMANYLINGLTYGTVGRTYLFDPIKATKDGLDAAEKELDDQSKYRVIGGRMAGEFLKSIPGGQLVGSFGTEEWRKSFFGQSDPTKYGTGLLAQSLWENPAEMMVYQVALPFGGVQARRMVQSIMALTEGGVYTTNADPFTIGEFIYKKAQGKPYSDELRFLTNNGSFFEIVKPFLGGVWSTKAGQEYIENNRRALSPRQTEMVRNSKNPVETYAKIMYIRERDRLVQLIKDIQKNKEYTAEQKKKYVADVRERLRKLDATR